MVVVITNPTQVRPMQLIASQQSKALRSLDMLAGKQRKWRLRVELRSLLFQFRHTANDNVASTKQVA